jgi:transcriptional regulator with XRE-family HTH domain
MFSDMLCQQPSTLPAPGGRADEANLYVCRRMKAKRILRDMSQERLAKALGISYQQLQRYESGKSRLPCSLLYHAALALDVPVAWFFEDIPAGRTAGAEPGLDKDALLAARNIQRMPEGDMRKALLRLIAGLAQPFGIDMGSR